MHKLHQQYSVFCSLLMFTLIALSSFTVRILIFFWNPLDSKVKSLILSFSKQKMNSWMSWKFKHFNPNEAQKYDQKRHSSHWYWFTDHVKFRDVTLLSNQKGSKSHLVNTKQHKVNFNFPWCFVIKGLFYGIKLATRWARIHAFGIYRYGGPFIRQSNCLVNISQDIGNVAFNDNQDSFSCQVSRRDPGKVFFIARILTGIPKRNSFPGRILAGDGILASIPRRISCEIISC